ncbi:type II toxin-antitoxin system VapC family toxin [Fibrella sp. HMF5335]|uniref:Type II toxin-antitoxin system VapC family toxin n=1 Tax=Fibrella rubiginis TaxID=2817060 RepID=A0A939GKI0_9BACT|nr:type II toxin-antitoxin system VapC family toxin [Fibrella rubiginis]MBO0938117.1 type II toxin-antitoxin system VapC family toxin [Fibrella rubiginis]
MTLLIDTEILLWFQEDSSKLAPENKALLEDMANTVWVSQISLIEVAIKLKIGKLPGFSVNVSSIIAQTEADGFRILPLNNNHISAYDQLPLIADHRDPFDRLILATALHEGWPVMSSDHKFSWYPGLVNVIW